MASLHNDRAARPCLTLLSLLVLPSMGIASPEGGERQTGASPALVLLLIVDQLRGDFLEVHGEKLGPDGLRMLAERGVHYRQAHFRHGITSTAPGHATIVTGAHPSVHGLVGNNWVDARIGREVYCAEDKRHRLLGEMTRRRSGVSPALMKAETVGDVLVAEGGGRSRVFGVSLKDRGAIIPAGRAGKAFWYSRWTGRFLTSDYYYDDEPRWLTEFNDRKPAEAYRNKSWELSLDRDDYRYAHRDDQPWERNYKGLGRTFPHDLAKTTDYYAALRYTPYADELTIDLVFALMHAEGIGRTSGTDMLAVSLSATDHIGHAFGPESLEVEDNMIRLDRSIARLLAKIDAEVGLDRTLVVLTSDHGIPSAPEYLARRGEPAVRIDTPALIDRLNATLQRELDFGYDPVDRFYNPSLYLNVAGIEADGRSLAEIEQTVAGLVMGEPGFAFAWSATELLADHAPESRERRLAKAAQMPGRSGQVYLVQTPGSHLHAVPDLHAVMHGSPYAYDTHVPIIFTGPGLQARIVEREIGVEDLAPSLAAFLGLRPPAQSTGVALPEASSRRPSR